MLGSTHDSPRARSVGSARSTPRTHGKSGGACPLAMMADRIAVREVVKRNSHQQRRRFWTPAEVEDLVTGVNRYGVGNWAAMMDDPNLDFGDRNNVDLKVRATGWGHAGGGCELNQDECRTSFATSSGAGAWSSGLECRDVCIQTVQFNSVKSRASYKIILKHVGIHSSSKLASSIAPPTSS